MSATLYAIGSTFSFVTMQFFIKTLSSDVSTQNIICIRSVLLLLFNSYFVFSSDQYESFNVNLEKRESVRYFSINIKNKKLFVLMMKRLFWNAVSVNAILNSLKHADLSICNALVNTTPVLTFFVEAIYFKKPLRCIDLAISVVCFIGVLVILNPLKSIREQTDFNWYLVLPLVSAFANCLNYLYLHQMRGQFKETLILEYSYVVHLLSSGLLMILIHQDTAVEYASNDIYFQPKFYILMIVIVFFAYSTHFLRIKALFKKKPSQILAYNYLGIMLSIIIDYFLFQQKLEWITILGVLLTGMGLFSKAILEFFQNEVKT